MSMIKSVLVLYKVKIHRIFFCQKLQQQGTQTYNNVIWYDDGGGGGGGGG